MGGLLDGLANLSSGWVYLVIGLLAAAEAAAFVGLFLPGELAMLFGGFLTSTGRVSLGWMLLAAGLGAVAGDSVGYEIGHRYGPALRSSGLGRRIGQQRWDRAERYVKVHGARAVFLGRFVGLLRALVPAIAGSSRMPYRTFLVYHAAGGLIWAPGSCCWATPRAVPTSASRGSGSRPVSSYSRSPS